MKSKLSSTVLVILVPLLILAVLGFLLGPALGIPELVLLLVVWGVGLWRIWRKPRT